MNLIKLVAAVAASLTLISLAASQAQADPIVADQWYTFGFDNTGTAIYGDCATCTLGDLSLQAPTTPWEITLATPMLLVVTDGFQQGDEFELFDFGVSIGSTSATADDVSHACGTNELACLADPLFSHGFFPLAAGNHSLTGVVTDSPFDSGAAFFIITQQVPEPGALVLLGIALAGLGFSCRKRS
jgi:hypothetical protein